MTPALAALVLTPEERMTPDEAEDVARMINGLVEAGDLLFGHAQRIDWDPTCANVARECWLESRAALSGDHTPKHYPPLPAEER